MTSSERAATPEQRMRAWAEGVAIQEAELGGITVDQIDRYADALARSMRGQGMALHFALDDLVEASGMRRLVGWLNDRLTRR